ncbi:tRNA lysidine(34) synthetase TilS [Formosa sp. Hel1_31_208]|uniref:tRNA lysidine(34) synthetase TilS n=1 Tax=Formosa sp. Hel1_31_208 TaxID=1798225 RepID=UPI0035131196
MAHSKCLLACSGGLDSVVLTHLCHDLQLDITLAHCNFNLRDDESDADEAFVMDLADRLELEVFVESFDTESYASEERLSIQMAARELRYNWFYSLADAIGFDYILTGHHADDNLETFLINLTRGTGINGLIGIPKINENIVRPLLPFSRETLESYATLNRLKWQEDSTNASDKYLRNKLRHQVIPVLKEINPELLESFKSTLAHLNDTADIVEESLNAVTKRAIVDIDESHITFKISEFKKVNNQKAYLYEMFKDYGFTAWQDILELLDAQSGKQVLSDTHRLIKDRKHLILTHIKRKTEEELLISDAENKVQTPAGILLFDKANALAGTQKTSILVDKDKLDFPLVVRRWKTGDVFHPLGMNGKKKLSKYFKDEKLSLVAKENAWLLCSKNNIVWVIGRRADERFKVINQTKHILRISIE